MDVATTVLTGLGMVLAVGVVALVFLAGYAAGRRHAQRAAIAERWGLAELWAYQRLLNDAAREIDGLLEGNAPLVECSRDELLAARENAYPFAARLPEEARWVVEAPSLPDVHQPNLDLVDVSFAYLQMADTIKGALERRASERIAAEAAQKAAVPTPLRRRHAA